MARKLRVQYEGAVYHLMNRGDHRDDIFRGDADRQLFLDTLAEACGKTDWHIHAWCLMTNHFHLVVETPNANLVDGMKWFLGTYTARFNRRHKLCGHLFSGRYKALFVDDSDSGYLKTACDYVHLNPARAKLLKAQDKLRAFAWSSFPEYLRSPKRRWPWLKVEKLLAEHGIPKDSSAGRKEFEERMELRRAAEDGQEFKGMLRGWCLGSKAFRKELLGMMSEKAGPEHYGEEIMESAEEKAQRLVGQALKKLGWKESDLTRLRKGDPKKVKIALRLRRETTMTLAWVAQRLHMGTKTHLAHLLYWHNRK